VGVECDAEAGQRGPQLVVEAVRPAQLALSPDAVEVAFGHTET
jgi:hypothetical protein